MTRMMTAAMAAGEGIGAAEARGAEGAERWPGRAARGARSARGGGRRSGARIGGITTPRRWREGWPDVGFDVGLVAREPGVMSSNGHAGKQL